MNVTEIIDRTDTDTLLEDTGELDTLDTVAAGVAVHLAKCWCTSAVRYTPSASGAGFTLVDADPDAVFGVGENGRPLCPNGHGEMAIADDQLKAVPDAFADAHAMLQAAESPSQPSLPGVYPAFNFEGAYLELEEKALEVDRLHRDYKSVAEEAREAKKSWDKAAELYTSMALELRRRRREKAGEPKDVADVQAESARVPCTWEQAHQQPCPVCSNKVVALAIERILRHEVAAPEAQQHATDVEALRIGLEVEDVVHALDAIDTYVKADVVAGWTPDERADVLSWANATFDYRHDENVTVQPRPAVMGTPHVPAEVVSDEAQVCTFCERVLVAGGEDMREARHAVTDLIGTDCPGKVVEEGHRYPARSKKKPAKKAATKKTSKGRR